MPLIYIYINRYAYLIDVIIFILLYELLAQGDLTEKLHSDIITPLHKKNIFPKPIFVKDILN